MQSFRSLQRGVSRSKRSCLPARRMPMTRTHRRSTICPWRAYRDLNPDHVAVKRCDGIPRNSWVFAGCFAVRSGREPDEGGPRFALYPIELPARRQTRIRTWNRVVCNDVIPTTVGFAVAAEGYMGEPNEGCRDRFQMKRLMDSRRQLGSLLWFGEAGQHCLDPTRVAAYRRLIGRGDRLS